MRSTLLHDPTFIVHVAMLGWIPFTFGLMAMLGATRGVVLGLVIGLFLLPNASYKLAGLPDYDKTMATSLGTGVAALCMDFRRVSSYRPSWIDAPVGLLCLAPLASSLNAGLGLWNGLAGTFEVFTTWGVAWILGRLYLSTPAAQRYFAVAFVTAALIYVPFCAFEIRMSPMLHELVYGIRLKSFKHAARGYGWRPNVFLEHGLMASLMMSMSALTAFWLWYCKVQRAIAGIPMGAVFLLLAGVTAATQSSNALLMLFVGIACLVLGAERNWSWPLLLLVLIPPLYVGLRQVAGWDGDELVRGAERLFGERRANSLRFRLENEKYLRDRAWEQPITGWSDMSTFTGNIGGKKAFVTDSLWLILTAMWGVWGLAAGFAALLIAPWLLWLKSPARLWKHPLVAPLAAFGVILVLFSLDCLLNAFPNPLFIAAGGGVCQAIGTRRGIAQWTQALS